MVYSAVKVVGSNPGLVWVLQVMAHLRAPMRALSPAHDRRTFNGGARMRDVSKIHHELSKFVAVC